MQQYNKSVRFPSKNILQVLILLYSDISLQIRKKKLFLFIQQKLINLTEH